MKSSAGPLWTATLSPLLLLLLLPVFGPRAIQGLITETTEFNKPKFSFACGTQLGGGGTPTFCSNQGDKKYVKVGRVDIYRDNSNKVGDCLKPEKDYITVVLNEWFNYDCKIPNVQRDVENKEMPTGMLQTAMTKYCSIPNARVYKIEVEYDCVSTLATGPPPVLVEDRGGILIVPPRLPVVPDNLSESTASTTTPSRPSTTTTGKLPILITADKESNTAPAPAPTPSSDNSDISTGGWIAIGFSLFIFLLIIIGLLLVFCCWLPSRREKRKQGAPSELGAPRMSTLYLVPGTYKNTVGGSGDDLSAVAYGGSTVENDYTVYPDAGGGRRSMDRSVVAQSAIGDDVDERDGDAAAPTAWADRQQQAQHQPHRSSRSSGPPSTIYGNLGGLSSSSADALSTAGGYSMAFASGAVGAGGFGVGGSRRSSADPDASVGGGDGGGFYDRRLSDRRLILARHPSETSIRSGFGGLALAPSSEIRKLSRTSYAELPSDRRASSGSSGGGVGGAEARQVSLSLGTADERRSSSELGNETAITPGSRRPVTYGGPGMPHIEEHFESAAAASGKVADGDISSLSRSGGYYGGNGGRGSVPDDVFYGSSSASRAMSLDATGNLRTPVDKSRTGAPGRLSWGGETETEINYSFWPPEWQRWLQNRPSGI